MHLLGMNGMQRRIASYPAETGFLPLNVLATVGAFLMGFAILIFLYNAVRAARLGPVAEADPWRANTLEWYVSSPPPPYNFRHVPRVTSERPLRDLRMQAVGAEAQTVEAH
jgi:cytochrome c oxidase subunit 1